MKNRLEKAFYSTFRKVCGPVRAAPMYCLPNTLDTRAPTFRWINLPREMRTQNHDAHHDFELVALPDCYLTDFFL